MEHTIVTVSKQQYTIVENQQILKKKKQIDQHASFEKWFG